MGRGERKRERGREKKREGEREREREREREGGRGERETDRERESKEALYKVIEQNKMCQRKAKSCTLTKLDHTSRDYNSWHTSSYLMLCTRHTNTTHTHTYIHNVRTLRAHHKDQQDIKEKERKSIK